MILTVWGDKMEAEPQAPKAQLIPSRDEMVAAAGSFPELIEYFQRFDPALADRILGRSLLASRTVWGAFAAMAIGEVSTKFALGWDQNTCSIISGLLVLGVLAFLQHFYHRPLQAEIGEADSSLVGSVIPIKPPPNG